MCFLIHTSFHLEQNKKYARNLRAREDAGKFKFVACVNAEEIYHRQYKAFVVIGMLANEINASRRVHADGGLLAEFLGEGLQRLRLNAIDVGERCRHVEKASGFHSRCTTEREIYGGSGLSGKADNPPPMVVTILMLI